MVFRRKCDLCEKRRGKLYSVLRSEVLVKSGIPEEKLPRRTSVERNYVCPKCKAKYGIIAYR